MSLPKFLGDETARVNPGHRADLRQSGLSDATIEECQFSSVTDAAEAARLLRWKTGAARHLAEMLPALAIPFLDKAGATTGFVRLRPDRPRQSEKRKARKYEQPRGVPVRPYFPPAFWPLLNGQAGEPILVTEGEKKAAKACQEGFATIGLTGVSAWSVARKKDKNGRPAGPRRLLPELAALPWKDREVFIVFDSDASTKRPIQNEEQALAGALQAAGAVVKVVRLPAGTDGAKVGLDDFLAAHGPDAIREPLKEAKPPLSTRGRTVVVLSSEEHRVVEHVTDVLSADDSLFQRDGTLLEVHTIGEHAPEVLTPGGRASGWVRPTGLMILRQARDSSVRLRISERCALVQTKSNDERVLAHPPGWLIPGVLARPGAIRSISAFLPGPTLDASGEVIDRPGYHEGSGYFLSRGLPGLAVPRHAGRAEAVEAAGVLTNLVSDFPFASEADCSRWLCLLLAACCRHLIRNTPLGLITANVAGSGKTLLARLISIIAHGLSSPILMSWPDGAKGFGNGDEVRKRLASLLEESASFALMDNLPRGADFDSDELNAFLTSDAYFDRKLHHNDGTRVGGQNRCLLLATGNNVNPTGDLADRTLVVRLRSEEPNPRSRPPDRFAIRNLEQHVLDDRRQYLGAALTIWKAFMNAGRPQEPGEPWGSFETFVESAVAAVRWVRRPDPLAGRAKQATESDAESASLKTMLNLWGEVIGDEPARCSEILSRINSDQPNLSEASFREALAQLGRIGRWPPTPAKLSHTLRARLSALADVTTPEGLTRRLALSSYQESDSGNWAYFVTSTTVYGGYGGSGGCLTRSATENCSGSDELESGNAEEFSAGSCQTTTGTTVTTVTPGDDGDVEEGVI